MRDEDPIGVENISREDVPKLRSSLFYYLRVILNNHIKNSKFVIADLTELKDGVYYEAGYAKALEKEVIFTCHEQDFDQRHFDIAQINTIKWSNDTEEQLKTFEDQLYNRIISTVGQNI